jgi:hypothetical protein
MHTVFGGGRPVSDWFRGRRGRQLRPGGSGGNGLALGGGGDVAPDRQVIEEADDLGLAHPERMALVVDEHEPSGSQDISVLGVDAIMQSPRRFPDLVEEPGHGP